MDTRTLLAGLATGVAGFLLGWVLFGMLLMGYFEGNIHQYEGLMKSEEEMDLLLTLLGNVAFGLLLAWVCLRTGATTLVGGLRAGAIVGLGVYTSMALMYLAFMNWYLSPTVAVVEVVANTVWSALMGAVAGAVLGAGRKAA